MCWCGLQFTKLALHGNLLVTEIHEESYGFACGNKVIHELHLVRLCELPYRLEFQNDGIL